MRDTKNVILPKPGYSSPKRILFRLSAPFCRERANDLHFDFWFCSHLQPLAQAATWQPLVTQARKLQHCTLSSLCKNGKTSSSLALQKFVFFLGKILDYFMISPRAARENTGISSQSSIVEILVFFRNHDILRTEVAVTCSHLAATCKWLQNGKSKCTPPASSMPFCESFFTSPTSAIWAPGYSHG